jgi:MYXO-CTERM domain-containing protein
VRGKEFTDTQKSDIRIENRAAHENMLESDAYEVPMYIPDLMVWTFHTDIDRYLSSTAGSPDSVQIDHIVPRVDRYGCGCGTNSPRNAAAVSAQLNNWMSNDSGNQARIAILCAYAKWPGCPGTPFPVLAPGPTSGTRAPTSDDVDDLASDASKTPNEIGGCAAGGETDGGVALAMIGLGILVQRRRKVQR